MEIKYVEWNLNARGGFEYRIPAFICDYIKNTDIFVLVEFSQENGWEDFKDKMRDYDLFCSPYSKNGFNQVCIGIKKKLGYKLCAVKTQDICDDKVPEFLHVEIEIAENRLNVIGIRIKTQSDKKPEQFQFINKYIKGIHSKVICLGDFNATSTTLNEIFKEDEDVLVYGPRILNGYYSFVFKDGEKPEVGVDWMISRNIEKVYNGYSDKYNSPFATYDWGFVNSANGYVDKTQHDYLNLKDLPDHAILKGMIEI